MKRYPLPESEIPKVIIAKQPQRHSPRRSQKRDLGPQQERILQILGRGEWFTHRGLYSKLNPDTFFSMAALSSIYRSMQGLVKRKLVERRKLILKARIELEAEINQDESFSWTWVYRLKVS